MNEPRLQYRETTWAPPWVWVLLWGSCLLAAAAMWYGAYEQDALREPWGDRPLPSSVLAGLSAFIVAVPLVFTLVMGRLDVEVWPDHLLVAFGPARWVRTRISFHDIDAIRAVTYRPIREFGGWGIRFRGGRTAWTVRGNRAVVLSLATGKEVYVGSRFPHRLSERIRVARSLGDRLRRP